MKQIILMIIVGLCIFATFGITYISISGLKDQERLEMKEQHELEILNKDEWIDNLTTQLDQYVKDEVLLIGKWNLVSGYPDSCTFYSNNTCFFNTRGGSYEIKDGEIIVTINDDQVIRTYGYSFSDLLTLTFLDGGTSRDYIKQ